MRKRSDLILIYILFALVMGCGLANEFTRGLEFHHRPWDAKHGRP